MSVEMLRIVNFIEKVTFKGRMGVGKRVALWIFKGKTLQGERRVRHKDRNTRPPFLPPVKPVCRSRSNS